MYKIKVDEYVYEIKNKQIFDEIRNECLKDIFNFKINYTNNYFIKYNISFLINNKIDMIISVTNRHYIIELLSNINNVNLIYNINNLNIN